MPSCLPYAAVRLIQDGLVEKIWEGTITVLSLDLVRAVEKSPALNAFIQVTVVQSSSLVCILNEV